MKYFILILLIVNLVENSFSQNDVGHFKFTVKTQSDSLLNDYKLIVINEKSGDTLEFVSDNIEQPIKLSEGSYEMICMSGTLRTHIVGVIIHTNRITFYDFKLENDLKTKHKTFKKRKNKNH